jgi:hypothetical protein
VAQIVAEPSFLALSLAEVVALVGSDNVASREEVVLGLGRIVTLHHRSSASYQICSENRYLFF